MLNVFKDEANKKQRLIRLGKEPLIIKTELTVNIFRAFKIIDDRTYTQLEGPLCVQPPYEGFNYYRVMLWTDTEDIHGTQGAKGVKFFDKTDSCSFNEEILIILDNSPQTQYLYVELVKGATFRDPGTPNGTVVIGRGEIPLPSSSGKFTDKISLVGLNKYRCVVEKGVLEYSVNVHSYVVK